MTSDCAKKTNKFVDFDQCVKCIEELLTETSKDVNKETSEVERLFEDFKKITDIYLQQSEIIYPYLDALILKLTAGLVVLRPAGPRYYAVFKFLYQLIKLSGFKEIGKKFPHETDKLPMVVELMSKEDPKDKTNWEARYVLTVWLSIVVLSPFDLSKFDTAEENKISDRIYSLLMRNFAYHDSCQQVTAFCLAKFLSRPDIIESGDYLNKFMSAALNEIANAKIEGANSMDDIKLIGYLRTLGYMYKSLPRLDMKQRSGLLLDSLTRLDLERIDRVLVNHLVVKVIQRAGLSLLPLREASWRYKRAQRVLGPAKDVSSSSTSKPIYEQAAQYEMHESSGEEIESVQYLEPILNNMLLAAQNSQTKIRWSAAKGLARTTGRLGKERANEVIDMILDQFFKPTSSEFAWHGGCLTLAEMSRQGFILEDKLDKVTQVVRNAIVFDKIKGSMATGAHIREAACYICWAMSRTYEEHILKPFIEPISINLLCTMLFDRELQCRRAASAAFQELIGRQGAFTEEEITILTDLDYHNVGQRQLTYLQLAPSVASRGVKYSRPFVDHLVDCKVGHWDVEIRRQASDSLSTLMLHSDPKMISSYLLPKLEDMIVQGQDVNLMHGAILALAKIIRGLAPLQFEFDQKLIDFVGSIAAKCEKNINSKQQGPKFMEAFSELILSAETANFNYEEDSQTLKLWESIVLNALNSDDRDLRKISSQAFLALYRTFFRHNKTIQDRLLTTMTKTLESPNESSRCGALVALATLSLAPSEMIGEKNEIRRDADTTDIILMSLSSYISKETHEKKLDVIFAQAKAQACESFVEFVRHLDHLCLMTSINMVVAGYDALLTKTEDYTFDKRGDIGVVVRRAAIRALQDLTLFLPRKSIIFTRERIEILISKVLQQAVSYNDTARELAGGAFYKIISSELPDDLVPHKTRILELLRKYEVDDIFDWRNQSTPIFVNLLSKPEFNRDLWAGLILSVGQLSSIGAKPFRIAIADYIRTLDDTNPECMADRERVFGSLMSTLEEIKTTDRSMSAALALVDFLLTECLLDEEMCGHRLAQFCWTRRGTSDPKRLIAIGRVLCSMLQFSGDVQLQSLKYCLLLLVNRYAKVRAFVAEQMYLSIMTNQICTIELESDLEAVSDLLSGTNWQEPLDKVKPVQEKISQKLGLQETQARPLTVHQIPV